MRSPLQIQCEMSKIPDEFPVEHNTRPPFIIILIRRQLTGCEFHELIHRVFIGSDVAEERLLKSIEWQLYLRH